MAMPTEVRWFLDRSYSRAMELFLIGAGHVGLVTAVGFAQLGHRVTVADVDGRRIASLSEGRLPLYEPGLDEAVGACAAAGLLRFTTDVAPPRAARFHFVTVGTPATPEGSLSMTQVEAVVAGLLEAGTAEQAIVIRSTLPLDGPRRLAGLARETPRRPAIVVNPEFTREGSALGDFQAPSRVVTGWLAPQDTPAAEAVAELYAPLGAPTLVTDARSAVVIKMASNVLLATKISFANEIARLCEALGADVGTVTAGIGLDPRLGPAFLRPGPGIGGSCLPEQAVVLRETAAELNVPAPLLDAISRSNEVHQEAIVRRVGALIGADGLHGKRIALLGLAFKADTDDVRHSPSLALARAFRSAGASVTGYDPRAAANAQRADPTLRVEGDVATALEGADAVVIATEWPAFAALDWASLAPRLRGDLVYDTRRIADPAAVASAGLRYERLGGPSTNPADETAEPLRMPAGAGARA
jgi:UDPglucose 6-dehydrogenase